MIHYLEFTGQDGCPIYQRADHISTFLVTTVRHKGNPPLTLIYLLLANNNRVALKGETLESLKERLSSATGQNLVFHHLPERPGEAFEPEEEVEAA